MTIEEIAGSRDTFNDYVYTPWEEAIRELEVRKDDAALRAYVEKAVPHGIPEIMRGKQSMVLFRHIATPNYEINRFVIAADALHTLQPLILEYTADKFNNRNEWKFSLGKLPFHKGQNRLGEGIFERVNIIDVNASNNVPLKDISTAWGENLVDFHHGLFEEAFPHLTGSVLDLSSWLHQTGQTAKEYYAAFFALFLTDAILFENFMLEEKEFPFTRDVILPAFKRIHEETGKKPLVVALEPTHMESDQFWLSHPIHRKASIDRKRADSA